MCNLLTIDLSEKMTRQVLFLGSLRRDHVEVTNKLALRKLMWLQQNGTKDKIILLSTFSSKFVQGLADS